MHSGPIGWTNLHSHQQYIKLPFSPHPFQYVLSLVFLMITILIGGKWDVSLWFWFVFLDDWWCWVSFHVPIGHLYVFSEKHLVLLFILKLDCFFLLSDWISSVYMFNIDPLSDTCFAEFFSHHVGFFFFFPFWCFFWVAKVFDFDVPFVDYFLFENWYMWTDVVFYYILNSVICPERIKRVLNFKIIKAQKGKRTSEEEKNINLKESKRWWK